MSLYVHCKDVFDILKSIAERLNDTYAERLNDMEDERLNDTEATKA